MKFRKSNIILCAIILALSGMDATALPPRTSAKAAKSSRSSIIDGQEFISVRDFAKHLSSEAEISDGNARIIFRQGEIFITSGSLCMAFREGESTRIAQFNHPAVIIGNDIFVPKKSALEAISRIGNFSIVESEDGNGAAKKNENHLIVNDINDGAPSHPERPEGDFFTPAINDIDRQPDTRAEQLEPSIKKDIKNAESRAVKSRNELDEIISEVGKIKQETGIDNSAGEDLIEYKGSEDLIELNESQSGTGEKLIDLSEPTGTDRAKRTGDLIAPRVDEVKSLFQRGIRAINNLEMDVPEPVESHTTPSNPQLLDSSDSGQRDATGKEATKEEEKPQPPNVYKLPTNLLRKNIKK